MSTKKKLRKKVDTGLTIEAYKPKPPVKARPRAKVLKKPKAPKKVVRMKPFVCTYGDAKGKVQTELLYEVNGEYYRLVKGKRRSLLVPRAMNDALELHTGATTKPPVKARPRAKTLKSPLKSKVSKLRVWHIPQVPMEAFRVEVKSLLEAIIVLRVLADYDLFQFNNKVKGDYCNAQGLEVYEDGEWVEWHDAEDNDIGDYASLNEL